MSTLEVLSYLTDSTFVTVVAVGIVVIASLNLIDRIGGQR